MTHQARQNGFVKFLAALRGTSPPPRHAVTPTVCPVPCLICDTYRDNNLLPPFHTTAPISGKTAKPR
jgi:hypothetical protein